MNILAVDGVPVPSLGETADISYQNYLPKESFYSGNGKLVSGEALQGLAEHLSYPHCMNYLREAFVEILSGLDMSDSDRNYYKWVVGIEEDL
jgi:hypothetical protein